MNHKLGIIVPYRDRFDHLLMFKQRILVYFKNKDIDYELIIVEQDDAKAFNRGKLLNIGFQIAKKLKCDYVVFHDIDMLPFDVDYSYSDIPLQLANNFKSKEGVERTIFDEYFSGVVLFPTHIFNDINGYSNEYWEWGFEDNDLLHRCRINRVSLNKKELTMAGGNTAALKFNGKNAYVRCKNIIDLTKPVTIFVSFYQDDIVCDPNRTEYPNDDIFSVFAIPGFDLVISYNSYGRYNFEIFDAYKDILHITSNVITNYKTNLCVVIDPQKKIIKMYQDGIKIGYKQYEIELYNYSKEKYMYLGVANPTNEKNPKYYRGLINSFAVFSDKLSGEEIKEISTNKYFGLTQNFGGYASANQLQLYYDAKFIRSYKLMDLCEENDGEIVNCEITGYSFDETKVIEVPHRRTGTFELLSHKENGYGSTGWKDVATRYNQLRFYNEVIQGYRNPKEDGLSNCVYKEHSRAKIGNITHIVVEV